MNIKEEGIFRVMI